jgi:hypothetical protein
MLLSIASIGGVAGSETAQKLVNYIAAVTLVLLQK